MSDELLEIIRLDPSSLCFIDFYYDFLLQNRPCILTKCATESWKSRKEWIDSKTNGVKPNFEKFKDFNCGKFLFVSLYS